jgi:hypothetical protein
LDRIADRTGQAWQSFRLWQQRFKADPGYTSAWLQVRQAELTALIATQTQLCEQMEPSRPGAEYLAAHDQLQKWIGQQWAIADTLKAREGRQGHVSAAELDGCGCGRGSGRSTSPMVPGLDPFEFE